MCLYHARSNEQTSSILHAVHLFLTTLLLFDSISLAISLLETKWFPLFDYTAWLVPIIIQNRRFGCLFARLVHLEFTIIVGSFAFHSQIFELCSIVFHPGPIGKCSARSMGMYDQSYSGAKSLTFFHFSCLKPLNEIGAISFLSWCFVLTTVTV